MKVHLIDGTYELFRQHFGMAVRHGNPGPHDAAIGVVNSTLQMATKGATHLGIASDHDRGNMQRALLLKIALVAFVALLLQIPVGMIRGLVAERKLARDGVEVCVGAPASSVMGISGGIRVAAGEKLPFTQDEIGIDGRGLRQRQRGVVLAGRVARRPEQARRPGPAEFPGFAGTQRPRAEGRRARYSYSAFATWSEIAVARGRSCARSGAGSARWRAGA